MAKITPALTLVVCLASVGAVRAEEMTKPIGKWERKVGKSHVTLVVEETRLHATFIGEKPCVLHADYAMTHDGVIFGVVTSIECDDDEDSIKTIFDAPFSCRFRIDEGALIIHDLKCHEVDSKDDVWNGRFKPMTSTATTRSAASGPTTCPQPITPTSYPMSYPVPIGTSTNSGSSSSNSTPPPPPSPSGAQTFQFYSGFIR